MTEISSFFSHNCKFVLYFLKGITVSLQGNQFVNEGNPVNICVDLSDVPGGGLECDVAVLLNTTDGKAGKLTRSASKLL